MAETTVNVPDVVKFEQNHPLGGFLDIKPCRESLHRMPEGPYHINLNYGYQLKQANQ